MAFEEYEEKQQVGHFQGEVAKRRAQETAQQAAAEVDRREAEDAERRVAVEQ